MFCWKKTDKGLTQLMSAMEKCSSSGGNLVCYLRRNAAKIAMKKVSRHDSVRICCCDPQHCLQLENSGNCGSSVAIEAMDDLISYRDGAEVLSKVLLAIILFTMICRVDFLFLSS